MAHLKINNSSKGAVSAACQKQQRQRTGRGAHNKQAEQRKRKGGREGGGERRKHTEPNPDMQKSKQRKAEQATKQKHSSETPEAGQHWEGTNTLLRMRRGGERAWEGRGGRKRKKGKGRGRREGDVPSYAFCIHGPAKEKREGAPSYTAISRITPIEGGRGFCQVALDQCQV